MWEPLHRLVRESARRLFDAERATVAVIPFARGALRGTLTVCLDDALLGGASPVPPLHTGSDLADWAGELAAQLLACVEHGAARDAIVEVGAPQIVSRPEMPPPSPRALRPQRFVAAAGGVSVRLETTTSVRVALTAPPPGGLAMTTQDILLF